MAVGGKLTCFDDFLNDKPTLSELCEHVTLGTDWYVFGVLLELDNTKLDAIRVMNEENPYFKATKMFELWLDTNPKSTRKEILETLEKPAIGKNAVAKEYKKVIKEIIAVQKATINQILQTHSESLSHLVLPTDVTQTLYTEGVISKETFDEIETSSGSLVGGSLKALSSDASEDPSKLRTFGTVLLHSRDTVDVAKDILKDYDKNFPQVYVSSPQKQPDTTALGTPLQNTDVAITKSNVTEVHLEPEYQYKLDEIKGKLGKLFLTVTHLIESTVGFELKELKRSLRLSYPELIPQLSKAESVDDVMDIVRKKCTIINIACLEAIINHCNIESAEQHVTAYKSEVETFCEKVKLSVCKNENFITSSSSLLKCETIEFTLEWNIDEHTLSEIKELLWKAFGKIAKRVLVKVVNEINSIIVTCYAPRHIMDILLMEAEKNLDVLRGIGLMKLTIGYCTVWDMTTKDKYVKDLEEMVIAQRKTLAENDQLIIGLKSSLEVTTSMDSEQQQDQSLIDTLSEKIKLLEKKNRAKTFDVEKLTREKEATDKVLVEKQEEIEKLIKEKATDKVLVEKQEKIEKLIREKGKWWIMIAFSMCILLLGIVITNFTITDVKKILVEKQEEILLKKIKTLQLRKKDTDKVLVEIKQNIMMLTRKKEATDKVLVEKQEEIEKLTREKEATDKVLVEKQKEIEKLTREKEATDKVLVEKQEEIEKLTKEKEDANVPLLLDNWKVLESPPVQTVMSNFNYYMKSEEEWYSPSFLSHTNGYIMCVRIAANGEDEGQGTHLSLYIHLMAGKNDDNLSWPFQGEVKVQLINHRDDRDHYEQNIVFDDSSNVQACSRVINGIPVKAGLANRVGEGKALFIHHDKVQLSTSDEPEYLRYDSIKLFIKEVIVYSSDLVPTPHIESLPVIHDFVIENFSKRKQSNEECISDPFYSHENGYKLSLYVYPNGRDKWINKYISMFVHLMKGENDNNLTFPFRGNILVQIVNWRENKSHAERLVEFNDKTDPRGEYGARLTGLTGFISGRQYRGYGYPNFLSHNFLKFDKSRNTQYVSDDDTLHIRIMKITLTT